MFIFRLFFGLIGMVFALLLLPFKLIKLPIAVILLPLRILLRLIARNIFIVIILIILIVLIFTFQHSNTKMPELTPAPAQPQQQAVPAGIIQPVTKQENGDSDFATDLYALMTEPERAQYSQNFYYAMSSLADGKVHTWNSGNIAGSLRANDSFENNSGTRCRHFNEVLKVHAIQQSISGTACDEGNGAWCKLKPNATEACGLGGSTSILDMIKNLF